MHLAFCAEELAQHMSQEMEELTEVAEDVACREEAKKKHRAEQRHKYYLNMRVEAANAKAQQAEGIAVGASSNMLEDGSVNDDEVQKPRRRLVDMCKAANKVQKVGAVPTTSDEEEEEEDENKFSELAEPEKLVAPSEPSEHGRDEVVASAGTDEQVGKRNAQEARKCCGKATLRSASH